MNAPPLANSISVVVPVYGAPNQLKALSQRLTSTLSKLSAEFEIILVDDACPMNSWSEIVDIASKNKNIRGLSLSRNFGQHYAITAGLDFASGEWTVVMDCDLQDQPEEIESLLSKAIQGFDIVKARRKNRKDSFTKKFMSKAFHVAYSYLAEQKTDSSIASFGIYSKQVIESIKCMREQNRTFGLFINWVGYKQTSIDVEHSGRSSGKSSYSLSKMINLAVDSITAHSDKPLKICIKGGFLLSLFSFLYGFWMIYRYYIYSIPVMGYTSLIVSMYFLSGLIISSIGVIGLYISKIFNEVKNRPLYLIRDSINVPVVDRATSTPLNKNCNSELKSNYHPHEKINAIKE